MEIHDANWYPLLKCVQEKIPTKMRESRKLWFVSITRTGRKNTFIINLHSTVIDILHVILFYVCFSQQSLLFNPDCTQWSGIVWCWLFFAAMLLVYTLVRVKVVIRSTWTSGKEQVPCTASQRDYLIHPIHRNPCLRAAGGAWRNQAVHYCPGIQGRVGKSVSVELRLWQECCIISRRTPLVSICFVSVLFTSF